jgi:hypothetical protein
MPNLISKRRTFYQVLSPDNAKAYDGKQELFGFSPRLGESYQLVSEIRTMLHKASTARGTYIRFVSEHLQKRTHSQSKAWSSESQKVV